jgi:modulator of FtsH protease HflK
MKSDKEKTIIISIVIQVLFTILKFVAFGLTGSISILAEAWHSFTDIITSCFVFISFNKPKMIKRQKAKKASLQKKYAIDVLYLKSTRYIQKHYEDFVALSIGLILFFVAYRIGKSAFLYHPEVPLGNTVLVGLVFIFFSFCSFLISKFQISVGKREDSLTLISDGMHTRVDVIASLFAGFSLLLYSIGINIDRFAAFIIAFFILCSSIEILVNALLSFNKKEKGFKYCIYDIFGFVGDDTMFQSFLSVLNNRLNLKLQVDDLRALIFKLFYGAVFIVVILYLQTAFFVVQPYEVAFIERFGVPINQNDPLGGGLHMKYPWPIDSVNIVNTKRIRSINIGNTTDDNTYALIWTKDHGTEEAFLSGDNNFFYPYFVVHYSVQDPYLFSYAHGDIEQLIDNVAHGVITSLFAQKSFDQVLIADRKELIDEVHQQIQAMLSDLSSGVIIESVNFKDVHPPIFIADAFEDIIAAYQYKEERMNEAIGYTNKVIPLARSNSIKTEKEAESYLTQRLKVATGDGERFLMQASAFREYEAVLRKKVLLESKQNAMRDVKKIVIDPDSGTPDLWLDKKKLSMF